MESEGTDVKCYICFEQRKKPESERKDEESCGRGYCKSKNEGREEMKVERNEVRNVE